MKFLHLVWRYLLRRKIRTTLTILAIMVSFLLFGVLTMLRVAFGMGVDLAGADRLMMVHKVAIIQPLPISYLERIRAVPGVTLVSHSSWFGGIYQDPSKNVFQFAVEPATYMQMYPEFKLPPEQMQAWLADRQGCIVGKDIAERLGWKVGDKIPIMGTFNRPKGGDGVTWVFNVSGIYDGDKGVDKTQFLFRYDYLDENRSGLQGMTGWYLIKVADPANAAQMAANIDALFANSSFETKTSTEKAMVQGFAQQVGNISAIMTRITMAALVMILLTAAITMVLSVKERTREIGTLKALGFTDGRILALVLIESLTIALVGAVLGLSLALVVESGGDPTGGLLPIFLFPARDLAIGLGLAVLLGLMAGAMPAISAMQLRITDALRRS